MPRLAVLVAALALPVAGAQARVPLVDQSGGVPKVWFAPLPPMPTFEGRPYVGSTDFMRLFRPNAPWRSAARRVSVFKLYGEWVAYRATRSQLTQAVSDLRRRRIALAVEAGPLNAPPECGQGVEGFAGTNEGLRIVAKLQAAGVAPRFLAFDEPFYYGSLYSGERACRWDTERVARSVATYVRAVRAAAPRVAFGDIEPLVSAASVERYKEWIVAYEKATGERLAFFHVDVLYHVPGWQRLVRELEAFVRDQAIPFGVIYNGDVGDPTDAAWLARAQARFEEYETVDGGTPDHAVFQSWHDKPDRVLPSSARTFTNLIERYSRPRTRLLLASGPPALAGRLVDSAGRAVAGSPIVVEAQPLYEDSILPGRTVLARARTKTDRTGRFRLAFPAAAAAAVVVRAPGSTRHWPAQVRAGPGDVGGVLNIARGRPVAASSELLDEPARFAVDGDGGTRWGAGGFAPQWIEVDLGSPREIAAIRLGVDQFPAGATVHEVYGRTAEGEYRLLHVFRSWTATGVVLEYVPVRAWTGVTSVRVHTSASQSWVAWGELEVFAPR